MFPLQSLYAFVFWLLLWQRVSKSRRLVEEEEEGSQPQHPQQGLDCWLSYKLQVREDGLLLQATCTTRLLPASPHFS